MRIELVHSHRRAVRTYYYCFFDEIGSACSYFAEISLAISVWRDHKTNTTIMRHYLSSVSPDRLTFALLYRHHVGRGAALDNGVPDQVTAPKAGSHQLRETWMHRR